MISTSSIFSKSLSAVIRDKSRYLAVAATMASGILMEYFCFKDMAMSFMALLKSITSQSFNKLWIAFISCCDMFFFPNNSISDITETPRENDRFDICDTAGCPSMMYIKTLVSTKKSIPFTANKFLVFHSVHTPFQFPKMFSNVLLVSAPFFPVFVKRSNKAISRNFYFF